MGGCPDTILSPLHQLLPAWWRAGAQAAMFGLQLRAAGRAISCCSACKSDADEGKNSSSLVSVCVCGSVIRAALSLWRQSFTNARERRLPAGPNRSRPRSLSLWRAWAAAHGQLERDIARGTTMMMMMQGRRRCGVFFASGLCFSSFFWGAFFVVSAGVRDALLSSR